MPSSDALLRWAGKGFWAAADQGLFSGVNFLVNILLARWLSPTEYGAFAVAFSVFLFVSGFHNALVQEPMLVLGSGNYREDLNPYFGKVFWMHIGVSTALAVFVLIASTLVTDAQLREALLGMALSLPFMLSVWLVRSMFYVKTFPIGALKTSIIYALVLFSTIGILQALGCLSPRSGYFAMGASGAASAMPLVFIRPRLRLQQGFQLVAIDHWAYGKWLVLTAIFSLGVYQAQTFLVAAILGLEAAGILRAMLNFILPITQAMTAIGLLVVPVLSREYGSGNLRSLHFKAMTVTTGLVIAALSYELGLTLLAGPAEQLLYGGKYRQVIGLLPILGFVPFFTALASGYSFTLRAIQRPQHYLAAAIVTGPVGLILSAVLTWQWGLSGAAVSLVGAYAVSAVIAYFFYRRWFVQPYLLS